MADVMEEIIDLAGHGYCCSQILVKLILDAQGVENPGLLRAMFGLCRGMAGHQSTCGLLTGGICALSYVCGKGGEFEVQHPMGEVMRLEYLSWFTNLTAPYGGTCCSQILGASGETPSSPCRNLLAQCWEEIVRLFEQYEVDPTSLR